MIEVAEVPVISPVGFPNRIGVTASIVKGGKEHKPSQGLG